MRKSKIKQISLAVCLAFMSFAAYAAGLGKLNVNSALGEPLKADIELLSVTPEELASLVATIASEDAYASQGITRLGIHNNIKIELSKNVDGSPIIKLRSTQVINDPYLDMLIQVDWATGRLQREYTILLDPPGYKSTVEAASAIPTLPPAINTSDVLTVPDRAIVSNQESPQKNFKKSKKQARNSAALAVPEKNLVASNTPKVITKHGDTLISVARTLQVEGVSLDQMLVGLYVNNKNAFSSDNMNRLKVGQIIKLPSKDNLLAIDQQQAKQAVKLQATNWNAYRNALAANVAKAPVKTETEQKQNVSGKIASAEDKAATAKTGPQDVVKLSAGEKESASKGGKESSKAADAKIIALQDEATAREKSLKESQDRTNALEKQIQDMQKLLALKSQTMNQLQKDAEATAKVSAAKLAVAATVVAEATKAKEIAKIEAKPIIEVKPQELTPVVVTPIVVAPPAASPVVVTEVEKVNSTPQPKKPEKNIPKPEAGLLESLIGSVDSLVLGATSGIALLAGGWMFLRNKRRKDLDSFERGILTSGGLRANTVFGNTTGNLGTSDTAFLTDFSQNSDGSMIDTNDVDPIAEAEVYMAYGRDAQAEEILKDAILKEPKRYELHIKLLEMYAARKDNSAFEAIAGELYTTLGADDPTWAKVAGMGASLEPGNPLYDLSSALVTTSLLEQNNDTLASAKSLDSLDYVDAITSDLDFPVKLESITLLAQSGEVIFGEAETESTKQDMSFDMSSLNIDSNQESLVSESLDEGPLAGLNLDSSDADDIAEDNNAVDNGPAMANIEDEISDNEISFEAADDNQAEGEIVSEDDSKSEVVDENTLNFDLGELTQASSTPDDFVSADLDTSNLATDNLAPADLSKEKSIAPAQENISDFLSASDSSELASEDLSAKLVDISKLSEKVESADSSITNAENDVKSNLKPEIKLNPLDDISFDMDFSLDEPVNLIEPQIDDVKAVKPELEIDDFATEISFDLPDDVIATNSASDLEDQDLIVNNFDLSSISLDLGDTEIETFPDISSQSILSEIEPPDVNIKLDLVAAYIDMDDKEGAIELLEEVMKEGGVNQKARAQELLDSLA